MPMPKADLNSHRPDWYTRRCITCTSPWPCLIAQALLLAIYLDARQALRDHLNQLLDEALSVRADDADQLTAQLLEWAFPVAAGGSIIWCLGIDE